MKIGLNDKLLTKALTEGKGKLPFTFDNGKNHTQIYFNWYNSEDADGDVRKMKEKLRGQVSATNKVVAPWLSKANH